MICQMTVKISGKELEKPEKFEIFAYTNNNSVC